MHLSLGHVTLMPGKFYPPPIFPQSDLGRRADSRWALPQISSLFLDGDCDSETVDFWVRNNATYDKLIPDVRRTFAIPASSAQVERVFSHGGIVLRPNRARMSNKLLSELVFLKCNICLLYTSPSPRDRTRSRMPSSA